MWTSSFKSQLRKVLFTSNCLRCQFLELFRNNVTTKVNSIVIISRITKPKNAIVGVEPMTFLLKHNGCFHKIC